MLACISILTLVSMISILYAEAPNSRGSKTRILIEAMTVQVNNNVLSALQLDNNVEPLSNVTVPLPSLLYILADPNSVKIVASTKIETFVGETGEIDTGERIKYLIKKDNGSFEEKTTDKPIGTTLVATPTIDRQGKIQVDFKFEHTTVILPKEIDHETSPPIRKPVEDNKTLNSIVKLTSGEPIIVGTSVTSDSKSFTLVRAEVLKNLKHFF